MFNTNKLLNNLHQWCIIHALPFASVHAVEATTAPAHASYMVKNLNIGELPVKTIVPITAKTKEQAIAQAKVIAANQDADIAEFRIDLLEFAAIANK
jgi:3-dehydroquinate dehydratase-1